ncbi:Cas10/Cmr2 second palm domain-containing protein [Tumebacillus algifaecis]|uniref:Cas10/Cmr2 second palm domain-containing protein n=1 Tax=Tumebacillus algifaecis TaxID=1214604 RepID=UPI00389A82E1
MIDWRSWLRDPFQKREPRPYRATDYLWRDSVTGVEFGIDQQDYAELLQKAAGQLQGKSPAKRYQVWTSSAFPFGQVDDELLAFHLPYPVPQTSQDSRSGQTIETRNRLADFVLLRVGLYYALFHPQEEEWSQLRAELLHIAPTVGELQERVQAIDHFLITGEVAVEWKDRQLSIVKAGAVKIKQYLLESNKIQEIRGASRLLEGISQKQIPQFLLNTLTPESVVYSGGGNILLILPEAQGKPVAKKIENIYREMTGSAQAVAYSATVTWGELDCTHFNGTLAWIEQKKTERQMTMGTDFAASIQMRTRDHSLLSGDLEHPYELSDFQTYLQELQRETRDTAFLLLEDKAICVSCRLREATVFVKRNGIQAQCTACFQKVCSGNQEAEKEFLQEMEVMSKQYRAELGNVQLEVSKDLDAIAGVKGADGQIAIVYGDGNNMGKVVERLESLTQFRYFSVLFDQVTRLATYTTIVERKLQCEVIAVGGDDVLLILPANHALQVARVIGEKFDQALDTYAEQEGMTISFGISIAAAATPFAILFRTASDLLTSAKQVKKQNRETWRGGSIDFQVLRSTALGEGVQEERNLLFQKSAKDRYQNPITVYQLMRPYSFPQAQLMEAWIDELQKTVGSRSILYHMRDVVQNLSVEEAKLHYYYYMLTDRESNKQRQKVHQWLESHPIAGMENDLLYYRKQQHDAEEGMQLYSPWHDLVELWSVLKGGVQDEA